MNQFEHITMIAMQRQAELLKEAEQYRLFHAAFRDQTTKNSRIAKVMAYFGKGLASAGHSLEIRFSEQSEQRTALNLQTNPNGCT